MKTWTDCRVFIYCYLLFTHFFFFFFRRKHSEQLYCWWSVRMLCYIMFQSVCSSINWMYAEYQLVMCLSLMSLPVCCLHIASGCFAMSLFPFSASRRRRVNTTADFFPSNMSHINDKIHNLEFQELLIRTHHTTTLKNTFHWKILTRCANDSRRAWKRLYHHGGPYLHNYRSLSLGI